MSQNAYSPDEIEHFHIVKLSGTHAATRPENV